jgi:hypothetical protein
MNRNVIRPVAHDPQPMLGTIAPQPVRSTWHTAINAQALGLNTARWQTRAARGFSWNRGGRAFDRRFAH